MIEIFFDPIADRQKFNAYFSIVKKWKENPVVYYIKFTYGERGSPYGLTYEMQITEYGFAALKKEARENLLLRSKGVLTAEDDSNLFNLGLSREIIMGEKKG